MNMQYSPTGRILYLQLASGDVAESVEVDELVVVDIDASGNPLGVEFVVADDLFPFLERHSKPHASAPGIATFAFPEGIAELVRAKLGSPVGVQ
jgi:uncharacterized protein YuzE